MGELGGRVHHSMGESLDEAQTHISDLSFQSVMNSAFSRKYLYSFLENRTPPQQDLVSYVTNYQNLSFREETWAYKTNF